LINGRESTDRFCNCFYARVRAERAVFQNQSIGNPILQTEVSRGKMLERSMNRRQGYCNHETVILSNDVPAVLSREAEHGLAVCTKRLYDTMTQMNKAFNTPFRSRHCCIRGRVPLPKHLIYYVHHASPLVGLVGRERARRRLQLAALLAPCCCRVPFVNCFPGSSSVDGVSKP
jgi:ferredoxin-thioredoxin reductase catalytic subunit